MHVRSLSPGFMLLVTKWRGEAAAQGNKRETFQGYWPELSMSTLLLHNHLVGFWRRLASLNRCRWCACACRLVKKGCGRILGVLNRV
ncbi:hypothetical protein QBC37DRAFT_427542 [Rhypophila decipiens]|uniref:Uncharacterized protein n=1 Tax=Rhypophila decipiens TaxID=261697 RepID=A0AAN6Y2N1_9PEZI|nr:hypothetical protein QBC37DRAFT_427542 [Rhypophila decipiens]